MAFRTFKADDLTKKLGLALKNEELFSEVTLIQPSKWLEMTLKITQKMPKMSEKAKSEAVIFPILWDIANNNADYCTLYSGETLNADIKKGLNGECDFIISKGSNILAMSPPVFTLVEAKRQQTIEEAIPQCAAQMVGAELFNQKKNVPLSRIYGCVTFADVWKFLKLENNILTIDTNTYYFDNIPLVLGVLQNIVNFYKNQDA